MLERDLPGGIQLFKTNLAGSRYRQMTFGPGQARLPRWSPFGKRIFYLQEFRNQQPYADLMVMGARGRHKRRLVVGGSRYFITDMAWGPFGRRIVLAVYSGGASDLYVLFTDTGRLTRLHVNNVPDRDPVSVDWSPDGRTIVFSAVDYSEDGDELEDIDLYSVRPDGSRLRQLTDSDLVDESEAKIGPTGNRLVYSRRAGNGCWSILLSRLDATHPTRLAAGCRTQRASWSPGGARLLVERYNRMGEPVTWVMDRSGAHARMVAVGSNADWRPPTG